MKTSYVCKKYRWLESGSGCTMCTNISRDKEQFQKITFKFLFSISTFFLFLNLLAFSLRYNNNKIFGFQNFTKKCWRQFFVILSILKPFLGDLRSCEVPHAKNVGPISSTFLTFIGYKQNRQTSKIYLDKLDKCQFSQNE